MTETTLIVYATAGCGGCARTRRFLDAHQIEYRWIDIDHDAEAEARVRRLNRGNRSVPIPVFPDGSILVEPGSLQLAQRLGIKA
jgi:mycoredoxin